MYLESLIECLYLRYLVLSFKWRVELGAREIIVFLFQRKSSILSISFLIYSGIVELCNTVWIKGFGLQLSFYLSKKVSLCSLNGSFLLYLHVICPNWSFWGWTGSVTKINSTWFNRKLWSPHLSSLINSIVICSSQKGVVFENFIFVLDASSHSFKITGNIS